MVLSACGSGDDPQPAASDGGAGSPSGAKAPAKAVDAVLAKTFGAQGRAPRSGRLDVSMRVTGKGVGPLTGPLSVGLSGPFEFARQQAIPRFDMTTRVQMQGTSFRSGAISTGRAGFLRMRGRTFRLPDDLFRQIREGLSGGGAGGAPTFRSLGVDPRRWLKDPRTTGTERLDGVRTTHVEGAIDVSALLDDLDKVLGQAGQLGVLLPGQSIQRLSPAERRRIISSVRGTKAELWTGAEDRILRRLRTDVDLADGGALDLRLDIADVNRPQTIETPTGARPFSELLPGGLGALLGGGGGAKALECLQGAGQDPTALQRCAQKLGVPG